MNKQNASRVTSVFFPDGEILYICAKSDLRRFRSSGTSTVSRRKLDMHRKQIRRLLALTGNIYNRLATKNINLEFCNPGAFKKESRR